MRIVVAAIGRLKRGPETELAERYLKRATQTGRSLGLRDIEIVETGLRPGEKLYEELLIGDNPEPTNHPRILRAREKLWPWLEMKQAMDELDAVIRGSGDPHAMVQVIARLVPEYTPDPMWRERLTIHAAADHP